MSRTPFYVPAAAALLFALAACSGGASDGGAGPGGPGTVTAPATAAEWCETYQAQLAGRYAACRHGALAWAQDKLDPAKLCADPVKAVAAGRAAYDRTAASACLGFVAAASCTTLDGLFAGTAYEASCGSAILGKGAVNGACHTDADCASSRCDTATSCPGVCVAASGANGLPCQDRRDCAPGFYCAWSAAHGYLTCLPLSNYPGLGETCSAGVTPCEPGLYCDGTVAPNKCKALKTSGPCSSSGECAPGLRCTGGSCLPIPGPSDACSQVLGACGPGLYCAASSKCSDEVGVGAQCTQVGGYYAGCIGGTCDPGGACVRANLSGDFCATDLACGPLWVCRQGACVTPPCAEP